MGNLAGPLMQWEAHSYPLNMAAAQHSWQKHLAPAENLSRAACFCSSNTSSFHGELQKKKNGRDVSDHFWAVCQHFSEAQLAQL